MKLEGGCTRRVLLVGSYAVKLPRFGYGWRSGLQGLIHNLNEATWSRYCDRYAGLCPVVFSLPGGFLNVMQRARPLTSEEWSDFDYEAFVEHDDYRLPVENKDDSFGIVAGRIVAVDYG